MRCQAGSGRPAWCQVGRGRGLGPTIQHARRSGRSADYLLGRSWRKSEGNIDCFMAGQKLEIQVWAKAENTRFGPKAENEMAGQNLRIQAETSLNRHLTRLQ